ncbi:hypothetical protein NMT12_60143 [metagenome]
MATINAVTGSGLKLKKSVFEKGRDRDEIKPELASQTGNNPITIRNLEVFDWDKIGYLTRPTIPPTLVKIIPIIRDMCGGLSNPSRPKLECHKKSIGPALMSTAIPITPNFSEIFKDFLSSILCQIKNDMTVPIKANATPEYITP